MAADILHDPRFAHIEPVTAGWSNDRKYAVTTHPGDRYLLRISPIARHESRQRLFRLLQRVAALGVPMCQPVELGTCDDGVYLLLSWIDGEDLRTALPLLPTDEQYRLGVASGEILRTIHTIDAPGGLEDWSARYNAKIDTKIRLYAECGIAFNGDDRVLRYIADNRDLLDGRPQTFQHGDYHDGNMLLSEGGLHVIDFDRADSGDPWEEFNRIVWSAQASTHFATGQLRGYFDGEPPREFFRLLALYIATNTLSSIPWAIPFGQSEIDTMLDQATDVLTWYDDMRNPVPTWYLGECRHPGRTA